uniref:hypothetical protein n=1 Tax=Amycolatopsis sp. CA-128772 TaxID=2073159 RepID=UPI0018EE3DC6
MKSSPTRRTAKTGGIVLSFGGWGDYEVWAAHGFTPKPNSGPADPQAEPGEAASGGKGEARAGRPGKAGRGTASPGEPTAGPGPA